MTHSLEENNTVPPRPSWWLYAALCISLPSRRRPLSSKILRLRRDKRGLLAPVDEGFDVVLVELRAVAVCEEGVLVAASTPRSILRRTI